MSHMAYLYSFFIIYPNNVIKITVCTSRLHRKTVNFITNWICRTRWLTYLLLHLQSGNNNGISITAIRGSSMERTCMRKVLFKIIVINYYYYYLMKTFIEKTVGKNKRNWKYRFLFICSLTLTSLYLSIFMFFSIRFESWNACLFWFSGSSSILT